MRTPDEEVGSGPCTLHMAVCVVLDSREVTCEDCTKRALLQIVANFGATPFKGDLDKIMASASYKLDQQIQHSQIPTNRLVDLSPCNVLTQQSR